jgi:hypothetical protein
MTQSDTTSLANLLGPWVDSDLTSGLVERCKNAWSKPLRDLSREELATLLRQRLAVEHLLPIAKKRLDDGIDDHTEMYDGELESAIEFVRREESYKETDEQLTKLHVLVIGASSAAKMYAYAAEMSFRKMLTSPQIYEFSEFRQRAEELSRPYPVLRPMLDRLHEAIEDLVARGRGGCLSPETDEKVLYSHANPCHVSYCELQKLAEET